MSDEEGGNVTIDHKTLAIDILQTLNRASTRIGAIQQILVHLKRHLKVSATAIRLQDGKDYPYYVFDGLSDVHIEMENNLCGRDQEGNLLLDESGEPILECMCGRVLRENTDSGTTFFTDHGSFWTNNSGTLLLDSSHELGHTRNVCNSQGYLSGALIPLRDKAGVIGLLQLNDTEPNRFNEELIWFLEGIGESIGIALAQLEEENLRKELEVERRHLLYQYKLRINQLDTLYRISKVQENKDISMDEMLGLIVSLVPNGLQYPDISVAELTIEDRKYSSDKTQIPRLSYSAVIHSYGAVLGKLTVWYIEDMKNEFKGPFLEEEIKLVNLIAETLSRIIEGAKVIDWNRAIDRYALVMDKDEITHIMKLVAEDIAISEMDRKEYQIGDVPSGTSQSMESYMQLSHNLDLNRGLVQKLRRLLAGE